MWQQSVVTQICNFTVLYICFLRLIDLGVVVSIYILFQRKTPDAHASGVCNKNLAVTYFYMGRAPHYHRR